MQEYLELRGLISMLNSILNLAYTGSTAFTLGVTPQPSRGPGLGSAEGRICITLMKHDTTVFIFMCE
jgi:hypothetical protein